MTYQWREGLENFVGCLYFLNESADVNIPFIKKQLPNIENLASSMRFKRSFWGGWYRSLRGIEYLPMALKKLGYNGRPRPATFIMDEDNIPSHDPDIDIAGIATGSTTTDHARQQMKNFIDSGVKTFLITFTTPEMLEERRKNEGNIKSAWEDFKKQENFEKQVIYILQRPDKRKDPLYAPLNTEFEDFLKPLVISMGDCMKNYHNLYEDSDTIPLKTISDTLSEFKDYFTNYLIPSCHEYQNQIYKLIQAIKDSYDVRIVCPYINNMSGNSFKIRLVNCGFNGKEKTVDTIKSKNYGREGSSDINSDTLVIGISIDGKDVFTNIIMEEAMEKRVKQRFYVGNPKSKIAKYATEIIPVHWTVPGYTGVFGGFGYIGAELIFDAVISQVAKELHLTEEDLRREHSQHG